MYLKKLSGKYVVTAMLAVNGGLSVGMPTIANKVMIVLASIIDI